MAGHFATVGHSNRPLDVFLDILGEARIDEVIDVRSFPASRSNPSFNADRLPADLARRGMGYRHMRDLGGRRGRQPDVDDRVNALWRVRSFHNYADYALGETFTDALGDLLRAGREKRLALMCSEAVWWRCHRRIIADHLLARGHDVEHLMGAGRIQPASLTPGARRTAEGKVVYPPS